MHMTTSNSFITSVLQERGRVGLFLQLLNIRDSQAVTLVMSGSGLMAKFVCCALGHAPSSSMPLSGLAACMSCNLNLKRTQSCGTSPLFHAQT